jgi:hypothetical protein
MRKWKFINFDLFRLLLIIFFSGLLCLTMCSQRSPVDLRDSNDVKSNVIIIKCDCTCDTVPKMDTIPII